MRSKSDHRIAVVWLVATAWAFLAVGVAQADFIFGEPEMLGPGVDSARIELWPRLSTDGLSFYFIRTDDYQGPHELWMSAWVPEDNSWDTATYLGPWDDVSSYQSMLSVPGVTTADGIEMFLPLKRVGGCGGVDIWTATRPTVDDPWGAAVNLGSVVNSSTSDTMPWISADGLELYFSSDRLGGYGSQDLYVTTRESVHDPWSEPTNLGPAVNSEAWDTRASLSPDGLLLFFDSHRPGGYGHLDMYVARRATHSDPWEQPVNVGPVVNATSAEELPLVSPDGSTLFFDSDRLGGLGPHGIWCAPIIPIVDFNGDEIVDCVDICIMIDCWGTDDALCDIGPMPWGDGIVDAQDLIVLAEYLTTDVNDVNDAG